MTLGSPFFPLVESGLDSEGAEFVNLIADLEFGFTEQFVRLVRETPAGREVKLAISRGGSVIPVSATIGQRRGVDRSAGEGQGHDRARTGVIDIGDDRY